MALAEIPNIDVLRDLIAGVPASAGHKALSEALATRYPQGGVADLAGMRPTGSDPVVPMVAELKVIGGGYQPKCFDGHGDLTRYSLDANAIVPSMEQIAAATGNSLLVDVRRLEQVPHQDPLSAARAALRRLRNPSWPTAGTGSAIGRDAGLVLR
ncbi:MAG: hypothetical protein M0Z28_14630 [Rhodospirillales bacterium]|nr:hypothetical protein [Rhodospirillales bacterium]